MLINLLIFLFALSFLVIVHELGHFFAAKYLGVGVEKFAIGFPPKIWSKKVGETEYKINALPLGGYVSLTGENVEEEGEKSTDPKNLLSRTPVEHLLIFVAGVFMNYLLGVFLLWLVFSVGTQPILDKVPQYKGLINTMQTTVDEVEKETPAAKADVRKGDVIKMIDGQRVYSDTEVVQVIQSKIDDDGATVTLTLEREGQELEKTISTYKSTVKGRNNKDVEINRIGINLKTIGELKTNPLNAIKIAFAESFRIIKLTFLGIVNLFQLLFTQFKLSNDVSGPVGVYIASSYFVELGLTSFIQFMAVISLTLALFNILPIPALDGGQIFFTLLEVVFRRKFSHKTKNIIQLVGFGLLILLMVAVTIKDVTRFIF